MPDEKGELTDNMKRFASIASRFEQYATRDAMKLGSDTGKAYEDMGNIKKELRDDAKIEDDMQHFFSHLAYVLKAMLSFSDNFEKLEESEGREAKHIHDKHKMRIQLLLKILMKEEHHLAKLQDMI